jgi:hypothetical protein
VAFLKGRLPVWNSRCGTHLGSGHVRPRQQTGHMIAIASIRTLRQILQAGGRPHMGRGLHGRYPPSPVPVQGCTSHPGHRAGRHDAQAAREQTAKPPAGTALAPMTRCAPAPRPSRAKMRSGHTPPQRQPIASNRKCPKSPAGLILRRRATSPAVSQHRRRADAGFTVHLSRRRRGLRVAQILPAHKIREDASLHSRAGASL